MPPKKDTKPAQTEDQELDDEDLLEEDDDLFDDDDEDDLLDDVIEDDAQGWVPEEKGEGIQGKVIKVGEVRSDFEEDPAKAMVPAITIQDKKGDKYRIIGYGAVLRRELQDNDPQIGDTLAVKYFGEKPIRKGKYAGKPYKHFGVAVRRGKRE